MELRGAGLLPGLNGRPEGVLRKSSRLGVLGESGVGRAFTGAGCLEKVPSWSQ